jgi:hypothetical protein
MSGQSLGYDGFALVIFQLLPFPVRQLGFELCRWLRRFGITPIRMSISLLKLAQKQLIVLSGGLIIVFLYHCKHPVEDGLIAGNVLPSTTKR